MLSRMRRHPITEAGRRSFPERVHMRIYLYRGCDGLRQYIQMMKWNHHLGVEEAYRIVQALFDDTWETSIEECLRRAGSDKEENRRQEACSQAAADEEGSIR